MKRLFLMGLASVLSLLAAVGIGAHEGGATRPTLMAPGSLSWKDGPPSLPAGAKYAVLEGDPSKEGPFTMRLRLPGGYRIPPHTHPKTERLTVLSGTFLLGMGDRFDKKGLQALPEGTYGFWPAGMKHFASCRGETVVQLHGMGPWQIIYLDPRDDPRKAK